MGNCLIKCNILVLITLRELGGVWNEPDRGWDELGGGWDELGGGWDELGGGGWSWVEVGARFSNTQ